MKLCSSSALFSGAPVGDLLRQLGYKPSSIDEQITMSLISSTSESTEVARSSSHLTNSTSKDHQIRFSLQDRVRRSLNKLASDVLNQFNIPQSEVLLSSDDFVSICFFSKFKSVQIRKIEAHLTAQDHGFLARPLSELIGQARERIYSGDYRTAYQILSSITPENRKDNVNYMLGLCTNFFDRPEDSETHFRKVLVSSDALWRVQASYVLSMLYLRMHKPEKKSLSVAEILLQNAYQTLAQYPDIDDSVFHKVFNRNGFALCLFRRDQPVAALEMLEEGLAILNTENEGARALHRSVLTYNAVQCLRSLKRFKECEEKCEELIAMDPKFPEYQMEKGRIMIDQEKYPEALESLDRAKALDQFIPEIYALEAFCFLEMGFVEKASTSYRHASFLDPQNPNHILDLEYCLSELGQEVVA